MDNQALSDQHIPSHRNNVSTQIIKKLRDVQVPSGEMKEEEQEGDAIKNLLF